MDTTLNQKLYDLGYLWHVKQDDLLKLAPGDEEFRRAIVDIQNRYPMEYAKLSLQHHGAIVEPEGKLGPAAVDLIEAERFCPLPDVAPPPGVAFHFDDPAIQQAVESMQRAIESDSKGSGAWPYACWDGFKMHRLVVAVDFANATQKWKDEWPWIIEQCRINYSWTGIRIDFVAAGQPADVRLRWVTRSSGWIGLAEFPSGRCNDEVFCQLLASYSPNRGRMLNLVEHELGHNNKLQHTPGNWIMSPVINDSNPDWRRDTHWSTLSRYYGGKGNPDILGLPPVDEPDPPVPPGDHNGAFVFQGKLFKIKVFE